MRANVSVCLGLGSLVAGAINKDLVIDDIARLRTQAESHDKEANLTTKKEVSS